MDLSKTPRSPKQVYVYSRLKGLLLEMGLLSSPDKSLEIFFYASDVNKHVCLSMAAGLEEIFDMISDHEAKLMAISERYDLTPEQRDVVDLLISFRAV